MSRQERVAEAIRKEVSLILHDELKDPRLGFVTIMRVELSQDLRNATIFFSVLGREEDCKKTAEALDSACGFIRKLVAQRINLRFAPEIIFRQDRSSEYSVRIEEVLYEMKGLNSVQPSQEEVVRKKTRKAAKGEPKRSRRVRKKER